MNSGLRSKNGLFTDIQTTGKNINFKYSNLTIYSKYFLVWICSNPPIN